jgi:hypothetical protein
VEACWIAERTLDWELYCKSGRRLEAGCNHAYRVKAERNPEWTRAPLGSPGKSVWEGVEKPVFASVREGRILVTSVPWYATMIEDRAG